MLPLNIFKNRIVAIASMHDKQKVIAPFFEDTIGMKTQVPEHLDTDALGTFSGEIERVLKPLDAALRKCQVAMELSNCDCAVATEGSFGPHPSLIFIPCHHEVILFVDKKNDIIISEYLLSTRTNFSGKSIDTIEELIKFTETINFPSHGVILGISKGNNNHLKKGIQNINELIKHFHYILSFNDSAYIESDMRAMMNPTRMENISQLTQKLMLKIQSLCPNCKTPGFGITKYQPGLPCELCNRPTRNIREEIKICSKCNFSESNLIDAFADAGTCNFCNP